jgi:hypothetical protein
MAGSLCVTRFLIFNVTSRCQSFSSELGHYAYLELDDPANTPLLPDA